MATARGIDEKNALLAEMTANKRQAEALQVDDVMHVTKRDARHATITHQTPRHRGAHSTGRA